VVFYVSPYKKNDVLYSSFVFVLIDMLFFSFDKYNNFTSMIIITTKLC